MGFEDTLEAPPVVPPGQRVESPAKIREPPGDDDEAAQGDHEEGDEDADDRAEVVLDERGHSVLVPPDGVLGV
jgi:hypothetical protein